MATGATPVPGGAYLVNIALEHAGAQGYSFDESGKAELLQVADRGLQVAHGQGIYTADDLARKVVPNMVRLTDAIINVSDAVMLTAKHVKAGMSKICPLFPFC